MQTHRVAVLSILIENEDTVHAVNTILHEHRNYIFGRLGLPYHKRNVNVICVALDAPVDIVNTMAGQIGRLGGVTAKATYTATPLNQA